MIMNCTICGKKMDYTGFGNYRCPECSHAISDLVNRPSNCDIPIPQGFGKQEGWICPVCGRGVAPWADVCPCQRDTKITYGTATGIINDELHKLFELNNSRVAEIIDFNKAYGE